MSLSFDLRSIPAPEETVRPALAFTKSLWARTAASFALSSVGLYYLYSGRKYADLQRMILGALLILGSLFFL